MGETASVNVRVCMYTTVRGGRLTFLDWRSFFSARRLLSSSSFLVFAELVPVSVC